MNTEGGKKRVLKNRKGGDADGGAIELGSILAPAVLYGLRRALDSNKSKGRKVRGGNSDELLMETQETGMDEYTAPQEGGKRRKRRGGATNAVFVSQPSPLEGGVEEVLSTQLPAAGAVPVLEGGKKRKAKKDTKRGGDKDKSDDDQEGGKKRKAKKAAKRGGDKDQSDDDQEGGKKRKAKKAVKRGGDKDQSDDDQEGGKKRKRVVKRGGADDTMMEQYASVDQEGGKRKDKKDDKRGGAIDLFTQQLKEVTDQLNKLMKK